MREYRFHPLAEMFPSMGDEEIAELAKDMEHNGQLHPIQVIGDLIIDGCNRFRACKLLGLEPVIKPYEGGLDEETLIRFVMSCNISRRQLTSGQKAMIAAELLPRLEAAAKERQRAAGGDKRSVEYKSSVNELVHDAIGGDEVEDTPSVLAGSQKHQQSIEQAAEITDTNMRYVAYAKQIKDTRPDLAQEIKSGSKSIPAVIKQIKEEKLKEGANEVKIPPRLVFTIPKKGSSLQELITLFDKMQDDPKMPEEIPVFYQTGRALNYELMGVDGE